jgi:2-oxoglutarate ferredoxin oxidoreductase subunit delta
MIHLKEIRMPKVTILSQACKGIDDCGICEYVCPQQLFEACKEMNDAGYYPPEISDQTECTGCLNCMICCPDYAIIVEEEEGSLNEQEGHDAVK